MQKLEEAQTQFDMKALNESSLYDICCRQNRIVMGSLKRD